MKKTIFLCALVVLLMMPQYAANSQSLDHMQITRVQEVIGEGTVNIPQIHGLKQSEFQSQINQNLRAQILSLRTQEEDTSLNGDFEIAFYNRSLLVVHFKGYSYVKGAAHPTKIDVAIPVNLHTGQIHALEDLFIKGIEVERQIKELCGKNSASYRLHIDQLWDGWNHEDFIAAWEGQNRLFVVGSDSLRVYTIPSYATGTISGYSIPYKDMEQWIDKEGSLWKAINDPTVLLLDIK